MRGDIGLGEDYIAGLWETESIERLVSLFLLNMNRLDGYAHGNLLNRIGFVLCDAIIRRNSIRGARRNIKRHYDVGNDFYGLWLDETMTYSAALFDVPSLTLADGQRRKYARILERCPVKRASVLEIGCGWGGFVEQASADGHDVTAITISPAQHEFASKRINGAADIRLQDYRAVRSVFDMIVSIEMIEAVGERYWTDYFETVARSLRPGGRALIQAILIRDELFPHYRRRSDFIRHYVFPGGMLPSLQRFKEEAEAAGLRIADVFAFGQDYAQTLRHWLTRLGGREKEAKALGYDDAFLRNWQFYLGMCAASFSVERTNVAQIELVHA
jgi:cyclopropane-fatty-acyl-phospholipid synthase